jgi:hypothetical protein
MKTHIKFETQSKYKTADKSNFLKYENVKEHLPGPKEA